MGVQLDRPMGGEASRLEVIEGPSGCERPEDLLGETGPMKALKIRLMEPTLGAEPPADQANRRNGTSTKRLKGSDGTLALAVPRDRGGAASSPSR